MHRSWELVTEEDIVQAAAIGGRAIWTTPITERSLAPSITVTFGPHTRIYYAFVTTVGPELDGPSMLTLHASTLSDLIGFAADPFVHDTVCARIRARLVLIEMRELAWHRAKHRVQHGIFLDTVRLYQGVGGERLHTAERGPSQMALVPLPDRSALPSLTRRTRDGRAPAHSHTSRAQILAAPPMPQRAAGRNP
jgi:hypothetical protein